MSLSVKYMDIPVGAQEAAVATAASLQPFGTAQQVITGTEDISWATLEPGSWILDGSRKLIADEPVTVGWWSEERSDETGCFAEPPVIAVSFPQPYTATGLTFRFWPSLGHWCSAIHVSWYNGQTLLTETDAFPDSAQWVLLEAVEGFDRIEIKLLATNVAGQFAKIQQIQIGHVVVFGQDEIMRVRLLNEVDPTLCELSVDTMAVEIRDRHGRTLLPQKNQSMHLYRDGRQIAAHYITDSSREAQQYYCFQCQSAIGRLEDTYLGGFYDLMPLETLLQDVLADTPFSLDPSFSRTDISGYLPATTRREALQQIAFTIGAMVTTQGDGTIHLSPPETEVSGSFDGSNIFAGAKLNREAQIAQVCLYKHRYVPDDKVQTLLKEETVNGTGVLYIFSEPHHSYEIIGGTLDAFGDNWVRITANGPVTLTAQTWIHSTVVQIKYNPAATAAERGNVTTVENVALEDPGDAEGILGRLYTHLTMNDQLTQEVVISDQKAGQLVQSVNPWGSRTVGYISSIESEFTGAGHTANITIRGKEVQSEWI